MLRHAQDVVLHLGGRCIAIAAPDQAILPYPDNRD